jgi:alpha/beta superfamily hydrolase
MHFTINTTIPRNPITFTASWHENNRHLAETFCEKVNRIFFFILNHIVKGLVLASTKKNKEFVDSYKDAFNQTWGEGLGSNRLLRKNFRPIPIEVATPDGIKLRGTFFKNVAALETAPTVIFFQPNSMISKQGVYDWVLKQAALQEFSYNFVYFDYRGCGESEGSPNSKKDLFLDGESIYQFVKDKLHVPENDIHLYGWSLGGGVSSNVKEIHPECGSNDVIERSFTSINNTVKNVVSPILAAIAGFAVSLLNWNIESVKAIEKSKGKTLIVHHPEDELMKNEASLYHSLFQRGIAPSSNVKELNLSRCPYRPGFIHGAPLEEFSFDGFNPEEEISRFLFSSNCSFSERILNRFTVATPEFRNKVFSIIARDFQNGGHYWGSGEDAFYNRNGLSLTDKMRTGAITFVKT